MLEVIMMQREASFQRMLDLTTELCEISEEISSQVKRRTGEYDFFQQVRRRRIQEITKEIKRERSKINSVVVKPTFVPLALVGRTK